MKFTTLTFALFLPTVLAAFWMSRSRRVQNLILIAASYFFYSWWDYRFCALMLASTLVDFIAAIGIQRSKSGTWRRVLLWISCLVNLGMLGFFKYFGFFTANFIRLADSIGWPVSGPAIEIILPVGISFYTFQTMSYTIDVYRGRLSATTSIIDYAAYVSFFPQLVAGPIERGSHLLPQFQSPHTFNYERAVDGCRQILWGLAKKMIIADGLGQLVDAVYEQPSAFCGPLLAWATICFGLQIYCDFSAYSDIAVGTARLFGIELMRNFAFPYFSQDLVEFWRRWHISLSTWFRDYVYIPLGGSRASTLVRLRNVFLTFVISGLWHGASWNFVLWGALHGIATAATMLVRGHTSLGAADVPGGRRGTPALSMLLRIALTFAIVTLGWVFFRSKTLADAGGILATIAGDVFDPRAYSISFLSRRQFIASIVLALAIVVIDWVSRGHTHPFALLRNWPRPLRWSVYTIVLWGIVFFMPRSASPFIYFQF